jgi:hypothetical protein
MSEIDPNLVWLGHVQPTGLVVSPAILRRHGHVPEDQSRADSEAVAEQLSTDTDGPALVEHWPFFRDILGWSPTWVAGSPGGPPVPDELHVPLPEVETRLAPTWAVAEPDGGWQILVRIEAPGIAADTRGALEGWEATPHQRLERLLRETGVPTGLLLTDTHLRLVHAPRGETSGWLEFPLRELAKVGGRPMLGGLKLLLGSYRLQNDGSDRRLPALLRQSREAQAEVSTQLATQVLGALHELLRGLHAADRVRIERLAATQPAHLYEGLLSVLLRLVFLLYAEDRDLIPSNTDGAARTLYDEGYGVRSLHVRLLGDEARNPDTMDERRGAWGRLLALFRIVHGGGGDGWIRGRGGKLFDPAVFPFLQGQDAPTDPPAPAPVSDGCVLRILNGLLILDGERLSYRTLDVEQIGSVYETVMGFTVETATGPTIAIKAGKNNRTPVFVDLGELLARKGTDRIKFLKDEADRSGAPPSRVTSALGTATTPEALAAALNPIVDERGSPGGQVLPPGTPFLQPTDERRRSGSHYTPRSLTEPIVRHALAPAFERIGENARPEDVLDLKVCDPAMGSGAFLVEACRQLATRLVAAWAKHPSTRPAIPADEDEDLLSRRMVTQRCIYGVDKNHRAVDLARLSLWLATLARDHEFTFLDHALKCGDSLIGLTADHIAAAHWDEYQLGLPLFSHLVRDKVENVAKGRVDIQNAPETTKRAIQELRHRNIESEVAQIRLLGNAVVAAFFSAEKTKEREKERANVESYLSGISLRWDLVEQCARRLSYIGFRITPFHWHIEFPEVFNRDNGGFDAIVGNPPFLGGKRISTHFGDQYLSWILHFYKNADGNSDLVAYFFRLCHSLLRNGGVFGLISTNTIAQGDTRTTGLAYVLSKGATIIRATRRLPWPGEAAVIVSVIHVAKIELQPKNSTGILSEAILDGRQVRRISAFLVEGDRDADPARLFENSGKSFKGWEIAGSGFTFDDGAGSGSPTSIFDMNRLIQKNPENAKRIFPFIGGEELNTSPTQSHHRYVIDFSDLTEDEARRGWPDLFEIVEKTVKPERDSQKRESRRRYWWQFGERQPALRRVTSNIDHVIITSQTTKYLCFVRVKTGTVFSHKLVVFALEGFSAISALQSRIHELWVLNFGSSMKDDPVYTPSDCFRTFPFPADYECNPSLEAAGEKYHTFRANLMVSRNEGLTKTYNRFHARNEKQADIAQLRTLHHEMDVAVLRAYGWNDLADRAMPEFIDQEVDEGKPTKTRFDWPADFKDEVLARLLELNKERADEEARQGIIVRRENVDQEELEDA